MRQTQARNFQRFMADAGTLGGLGIEYPRLQLLTVADILAGQRFQTPTVAAGRHERASAGDAGDAGVGAS